MAAQEDMEANFEQEREIPVFTVVKNNTILKNIFLINSLSSFSETRREVLSKNRQDFDQTLLVGRHPDCDIRLEHPSISRFHLRIHAKPSSKRLSVIDLSSVHGTWISGKRIEPNIRVDVNEGDALRIGGSSRVYRLHWIPFHKAYDLNDPFVPPLEEEKEEDMERDENALVLENEVQSADSAVECSEDLISNQLDASEEKKDLDVLLYKNEDGESLVAGFGCSVDSALEALVSNQFETSKEIEDENHLGCKNEGEKLLGSASEVSKYLALKSFKSSSMDLLPETSMEAVDMPLESRDMQFVKFAWEGSEILLLDKNPPLVAVEETNNVDAMQQDVGYSHDTIFKCEEMPLLMKLNDSMNFSRDMEEGMEVDQSKGNDEYKGTPCAECSRFSPPIEPISLDKEYHQFEEESSKDRVLLQETSPVEIQCESLSGPALSSHLIENSDGATSDEENQIPPCNDDDQDGAWSFWSLSSQEATLENNFMDIDEENQGPECESARKERKTLENAVSGVTGSKLWSFWSGIPGVESDCSSFSDVEVLSHVETQLANYSPQFLHPMEKLCRKPSEEVNQIQENRTLQEKIVRTDINGEDGMLNGGRYEPITRPNFLGVGHPEEEYFTPEKENYAVNTEEPECNSGRMKSLSAYSNKENQTPKVLQEHKSAMHLPAVHKTLSMMKKRETQRTPLQTLFAGSNQKSIFETHISGSGMSVYSNKENQTPEVLQEQKSAVVLSAEHTRLCMLTKGETQRTPLHTLFLDSPKKSISENHISGASLSAYSNKENQLPKVLQEQKSTWDTSAECTKLSIVAKREAQKTPFQDSPRKSISGSHVSDSASLSAYSNKENQTPTILKEQKSAVHPSAERTELSILRRREAQRMPFQTLFVDSPQKSIYDTDTDVSGGLARSRDYTDYENSMVKNEYCVRRVNRWTMVVGIACLLNKNSRKALQLLEGIKGTQLIIPWAVVKELDFMKQQASIFRKNTDAFLASQWIEECAVRTNWWVRIQSFMEDDGRATALTPSEGCPTGSVSYCGFGTLPQIVFPSSEDRVLDYALYLRRNHNDGQLVLLSDDTTMKIKAMAEGLICETAEEFRESLVSPFSKRFLWAESWPRGQTWSYLDDVILRENFYPGAMNIAPKGVKNAKGLKLILQHDSP